MESMETSQVKSADAGISFVLFLLHARKKNNVSQMKFLAKVPQMGTRYK